MCCDLTIKLYKIWLEATGYLPQESGQITSMFPKILSKNILEFVIFSQKRGKNVNKKVFFNLKIMKDPADWRRTSNIKYQAQRNYD